MAFCIKIGKSEKKLTPGLGDYLKNDFLEVSYSDKTQIIERDDFMCVFTGRIFSIGQEPIESDRSYSKEVIGKICEGIRLSGDAFLDIIDGDFAGLLIDKNTKISTIFRDCFGTEKLFYAVDNQTVYLGTDINYLINNVKTTVNKSKIQKYFDFKANNAPINSETFYTEIQELLPAHALVIDGHNANTQKQYWKPNLEVYRSYSESNLIEKFREALANSVKKRITAKTQLACNVSGGLDSSSILSIAARTNTQTTGVYFDTEHPDSNEEYYAKQVVNQYNTRFLKINKSESQLSLAKKIVTSTGLPDQLFLSGTTFVSIAAELEKKQINTILSGEGGDAIVAYGFEYLEECLKEENWVELKKGIAAYVSGRDLKIVFEQWNELDETQKIALYENEFLSKQMIHLLRKGQLWQAFDLWKKTRNAFAFNPFPKLMESLIIKSKGIFQTQKTVEELLSPHISKKTNFEKIFNSNVQTLSLAQQKHFSDAFTTLNYAAAQEQTAIYKAYGIACFHPFFDKHVFEIAMAINTKTKFDDGKLRGTLRNAMKDILPEEVRTRTSKVSFGAYANMQCRELLAEATDFLQPSHKVWQYVDKSTFEMLKDAFLQSVPSTKPNTERIFQLNRVVYLALWLDYIEQKDA